MLVVGVHVPVVKGFLAGPEAALVEPASVVGVLPPSETYARLYRSEQERRDPFPGWLHTYNHHRGHTALKGQPPASRVPNLSGQYIYAQLRPSAASDDRRPPLVTSPLPISLRT